jgi:hypothetical protein
MGGVFPLIVRDVIRAALLIKRKNLIGLRQLPLPHGLRRFIAAMAKQAGRKSGIAPKFIDFPRFCIDRRASRVSDSQAASPILRNALVMMPQ